MKIVNLVVAFALASVCASAQLNVPPAARPDKNSKPPAQTQPVTGKTSQQGTHINTSTTGSAGIETPGVQTNAGIAQQPGKHTPGQQLPGTPQSRPGAPPNWEQAGQEENLANINAAAAYRAEIGGPYGTLGVNNALPPSEKSAPTAQTKPQNPRPTGSATTGTPPGAQKTGPSKTTQQQQ